MDRAVIIDGTLKISTETEVVAGQLVHIYMNDEYLGTHQATGNGEVRLPSPLQCNEGDRMRIELVVDRPSLR